jgi:hypothetical protein
MNGIRAEQALWTTLKMAIKVTERRREDEGGFEAHCEEEQ